ESLVQKLMDGGGGDTYRKFIACRCGCDSSNPQECDGEVSVEGIEVLHHFLVTAHGCMLIEPDGERAGGVDAILVDDGQADGENPQDYRGQDCQLDEQSQAGNVPN